MANKTTLFQKWQRFLLYLERTIRRLHIQKSGQVVLRNFYFRAFGVLIYMTENWRDIAVNEKSSDSYSEKEESLESSVNLDM